MCVCVLGSWPRPQEGLSLALASKFFCVLGLALEPCVLDFTSGDYRSPTPYWPVNQIAELEKYTFLALVRLLFALE